jgi:hypothetical protein
MRHLCNALIRHGRSVCEKTAVRVFLRKHDNEFYVPRAARCQKHSSMIPDRKLFLEVSFDEYAVAEIMQS